MIPGAQVPHSGGVPAREVRRFVEKPGDAQLGEIVREGGQWNTLVVIATVRTLWETGRQCIPEVILPLEQHAGGIGTPSESHTLMNLYRTMPTRNFSSDVLSLIPQQLTMMELAGVYWSDWGRAERIQETLAFMGRSISSVQGCAQDFLPWAASQQAEICREKLPEGFR